MTVTEGEGAQEVTLTSTLPIVCSHDNECELQLELDVNGTRWGQFTFDLSRLRLHKKLLMKFLEEIARQLH